MDFSSLDAHCNTPGRPPQKIQKFWISILNWPWQWRNLPHFTIEMMVVFVFFTQNFLSFPFASCSRSFLSALRFGVFVGGQKYGVPMFSIRRMGWQTVLLDLICSSSDLSDLVWRWKLVHDKYQRAKAPTTKLSPHGWSGQPRHV